MSTLMLTYVELAERLGVSVDGARMKARRAGWKKTKGNDGTVRVTVEESELIPSERSPNVKGTFPDHASEQVRALEGHIATLTQQVEHLQQQLGKAEAMAASERARVEDMTASLLKLTGEMMASHQAQARPWWRRLAG
jgi:hypothetical protein